MLIAVLQFILTYASLVVKHADGIVLLFMIPGLYAQILLSIPYRNLGRNLYSILLPTMIIGMFVKPLICACVLVALPILFFIKTDIKEIKWLCTLGDIIGAVIYLVILGNMIGICLA